MAQHLGRFHIPVQDGRFIPRPQFDAMFRQVAPRLVLCVAPGGYAKSTVLAEWARQRDAAWCSLRPEERTPRALSTAILRALDLAYGEASPELHQALRQAAEMSDGGAVADWLAEAFASHKADWSLVLDDFHEIIGAEDACHLAERWIAATLDSGGSLGIGGRLLPTLGSIARWRSHPAMLELGPNELRFSVAESASTLVKLYEIDDDAIARAVHERTEGWPALVVLAGRWLGRHPDGPSAQAVAQLKGREKSIYDYLATQVLEAMPELHRQFLLMMALIERIPEGLVEHLFPDQGLDIVRELVTDRLIGSQASDIGFIYTFHPLLHEFLVGLAHEELGEKSVQRVQERAGDWFAEREMWSQGFDLWLRADRIDKIVDRMEAWEIAFREWWPEYGAWLMRVPAEALETRIRLLLRHAMHSANLGRTSEAMEWLRRAESGAERHGDASSRLDVDCVRAVVLFFANFPAESLALCDALETQATDMTPFQRSTLATAKVLLHNNDYIDPDAAARNLEVYRDTVDRAGYLRGKYIAAANGAVAARIRGDFGEQLGLRERLKRLNPGGSVPLLFDALAAFSEALAHAELGRDDALDCMDEALVLLERVGARGQDEYGRCVAALMCAEWQVAERHPAGTSLQAENHPYRSESVVHRALALAFRSSAEGQGQACLDAIGQAVAAARNAHLEALAHLEGARALRRLGQHGQALIHARQAFDIAEAKGLQSVRFRALAVLASLQPNPERHVLADLMDAIGRPHYDELLLTRERGVAGTVLAQCMELGIERDAAESMLRRLGDAPFRIRSFGPFRVAIGGHELQPGDWVRPQVKAFFAYLLLQPGHTVHAEAAIDAFWPEADLKAGRANLKTTLSRLRKVLPDRASLRSSEELVTLDLGETVWFDRKLVHQAATQVRAGEPTEATARLSLCLETLRLVGDEFLLEFRYEEWASDERQRAAEDVRDIRREAGRLLLADCRFAEALAVAEDMSGVDPLDGDAHILRLNAQIGLGRLDEARAAHRKFLERWMQETGMKADPHLVTVASDLGLGEPD